MNQGLTLKDYFGAVRRRAWTVVLTVAIGAPLTAGVAFLLPPVYESTARILVESQQIPTDMVRPTVTASAAERLQVIEQRLMTRDNLLAVIDRLNLFADQPNLTPTDKVELLRKASQIQMISFGSSRRRGDPVTVSTFTISYRADSPVLSARVANEFVTMVIEQNLQSRNERAAETNDFFKGEVDRLAAELLSIEGQITGYKRANEAALPDSLSFRRSALNDLEQRMFEREQRVAGLEESRVTLTRALATGEDVALDQKYTPEERELHNLEQAYLQQRAIYSESHPSMKNLAARIEAMRQVVGSSSSNDAQTARENEISRQIDVINSQLSKLADQRVMDESRKRSLEASIEKTPEVEMALNALYRRHSDLQEQYSQATSKQAEAETGEKLEVNRQSERFEVIEQARVPERPVAPNRALIAGGGLIGSIALGLGLAMLAEMTNTAIRSPRDLERWHDLHPVVTVPYVRTAAEVRFGRLRMAGIVLALIVVIPSGLYAVDQYYLPLPLIAEQLMDRLGIDNVIKIIGRRL